MSASARIRASIEAPSPVCHGAATWKHGEPAKCLACRAARRIRDQWDRDHPPVNLNAPHVGQAVADLLDARTAYEVLRDKHEAARQNWDEYRTDKALAQRIREREVAEDAIFAALDALEAAIEGEQR